MKIGFIDYFINEWHSSSYPAWIKQANEALGLDYELAYAWAELERSPIDNCSTAEWCAAHGAEQCYTINELCEKSDVIFILAPSNPETHLKYAKEVLPYGKPTYIDKTFADSLDSAKEIFEIAKQYGTPFFSSSALRYATELEGISNVKGLTLIGGGSNFAEYIIHTVEMAVKLLKSKAIKVKVDVEDDRRICTIIAENSVETTVIFDPSAGFEIEAELKDCEFVKKELNSDYFLGLITDIINFFDCGKYSFDTNETLEVIRIRDALLMAEQKSGEWVELR